MDTQERDRKLRLAESAAASAVLNGADPDEVRRRVEIGISEALELNARRQAPRPTPRPAQTAQPTPAARPSVLAEWAQSVDA